MIYYIKGDLLESDCTILAHQSNCFSVMGAGIAKQIKEKYPEAYEADKHFKLPPRERLGKFSFALNKEKNRMIFNLYGQFRYGKEKKYTDNHALEKSMELLFQALILAEEKGFPIKLGMPSGIGSGYAGGNQKEIHAIIEKLSTKHNRDVYLYTL